MTLTRRDIIQEVYNACMREMYARRNPLLLWKMDEYGDDWEQYWNREWKERK